MRAARIGLVTLGMIGLAAISGPAPATSVGRMSPHDPALARPAIEEFFRLVDESEADEIRGRYLIFTDDLGHVLGDELAAFLAEMNAPEGHPDRQPIEVGRIRRIIDHRYTPAYLVEIRRYRWVPVREDLMAMDFEPAHYEGTTETWLLHFQSSRVFSAREAWQLWQLLDPSAIPEEERLPADGGSSGTAPKG